MEKLIEFIEKRLTSFRSNTKTTKKHERPSTIVIGIFVVFLALAFVNISKDLETGFFENIESVWAQATGKAAPNSGSIVAQLTSGEGVNAINIVDQTDRCEIIDPNFPEVRKVYEASLSSQIRLKGDNISGFNQASNLSNGYDFTKVFEKTNFFGGSFTIGIAIENDERTVTDTAAFIDDANEEGLIPVVRLCVENACGFSTPGAVVDFYTKVYSRVSGEFIAMVGPNEPANIAEITGFGLSDGDLVGAANFANTAASGLQGLRAPVGRLYLSPGAFNLTNETRNEVKEMVESNALNADLYDYVMGNTYEGLKAGSNSQGSEFISYNWYDEGPGNASLKEWAETNNLQTIITEFGIDREGGAATSDSDMIAKATESFKQFCADDTVAGVIFFTALSPVDVWGSLERHVLTDDQIEDIIGDCVRGNLSDFAWQSCNFDAGIYDFEYDNKSKAVSCGVEAPKEVPQRGGAALALSCGGGLCTAQKQDTYDISLPIKHFGSNTSAGTLGKEYPPICAALARLNVVEKAEDIEDIVYADTLNQFAGVIETSDGEYPMPWLGSAINCSAELLKALDSTRITELELHYGSDIRETRAEVRTEIENDLIVEDEQNYTSSPLVDEQTKYQISDERAFCVIDNSSGDDELKCFDKSRAADLIKNYREYNPLVLDIDFDKPQVCADDSLRVIENETNYITGPEIKVGGPQQVWQGGDSEVCFAYATREEEESNQFRFKETITCGIDTGRPNCANFGYLAPYFERGDPGTDDEESLADKGEVSAAILRPALQNNCLAYDQAASEGEAFYMTNKYASAPTSLEIPGIYDSLYELYLKLDRELSANNIKIIFRENIGWNAKVNVKVRDAGRPYSDTEYLYNQEPDYEAETEQTPVKESRRAEIPDNIFNNEYFLARNNPIQTTDVYFDWLGYIDILHEISTVYLSNEVGEKEKVIPNPYTNEFENEGFPESLKKDYFLKTGDSNLQTSLPIYTCDAIERFKYENPELADMVNLTCIALRTTNDYDYTEKGGKYEDKLARFLCDKGYQVPDFCEQPPIQYCAVSENVGDISGGSIDPTRGLGRISQKFTDVHNGVDYGVASGTPLYPIADGTVVAIESKVSPSENYGTDASLCSNSTGVKTTKCYGNYVKIEHNINDVVFYSLYAHMTSVSVNIGDQVTTGNSIGLSGNTGLSSGPHVHLEVYYADTSSPVGKNSLDPLGSEVASLLQGIKVEKPETPLECTPLEGGNGPNGCNEFNCGMGYNENFNDALACASGLVYFKYNLDTFINAYGERYAASAGKGTQNTMDLMLDRYGPFCDTDTLLKDPNSPNTSWMPFAYNFVNFYDQYHAPGSSAGRICGTKPTNVYRPEDLGKSCEEFNSVERNRGGAAFDYYRGALTECPVPNNQLTWTEENTFGLPIDDPDSLDLADLMIEGGTVNGVSVSAVKYLGYNLTTVPREKVVYFLRVAQQNDINPYFLAGLWGTESFFGQSKPQCNVF